jgi:anti-anti-sigma regulatory factor
MSCRIDRVVGGKDRVTLRVSGRIQAENVDTLRELLELERAGVAIDLEEVILVDHQAVRLLAFSENKGTELRNCSAYIREWVDRERISCSFGAIRPERRNNR